MENTEQYVQGLADQFDFVGLVSEAFGYETKGITEIAGRLHSVELQVDPSKHKIETTISVHFYGDEKRIVIEQTKGDEMVIMKFHDFQLNYAVWLASEDMFKWTDGSF